jgi:hypothetical protein
VADWCCYQVGVRRFDVHRVAPGTRGSARGWVGIQADKRHLGVTETGPGYDAAGVRDSGAWQAAARTTAACYSVDLVDLARAGGTIFDRRMIRSRVTGGIPSATLVAAMISSAGSDLNSISVLGLAI